MRCAALLIALTLALLVFCAGRARAQTPAAPTVSVQIDRSRVTVGDPIQLTVTVQHAPNVTITTTSLDSQLAPFEPLSSQPPQQRQTSSGGDVQLVLRYTIAAYHTGTQQLPPFTIGYTLPDGATGQATSPAPLVIDVASVIPPGATPTDIRPLKPQASLPVPVSLAGVWLGVAALALFALLAGAMMLLFVRRRSRSPAPTPTVSAAETARAELQRILALDLPAKGELVQHYRLLGGCVRSYLARRFDLPATALTSAELAKGMDERGVARWPARLVSGLLSECDAVVYARYLPAPERLAADNAMAFEIVDAAEGDVLPDAARAG